MKLVKGWLFCTVILVMVSFWSSGFSDVHAQSGNTVGSLPSLSTAEEIGRDGRFIAYSDGTVMDTGSGLMWAAKDNGEDMNWQDAKRYCENYLGGGYTNWRMPTQDALERLYDKSKTYKSTSGEDVHLTELIHLTYTDIWAVDTRHSFLRHLAAYFNYFYGSPSWAPIVNGGGRALPVRSGR